MNIVLKSVGANKVRVIKALREVTSLGLREAKAIVDRVESGNEYIITDIQETEAQIIIEKFTQIGAVVTADEERIHNLTEDGPLLDSTKICNKCGFELVDGAKFCNKCGEAVDYKRTVNNESGGGTEESGKDSILKPVTPTVEEDSNESSTGTNKFGNKIIGFIEKVFDFHENLLNNYRVPAIILFVVEALIIITLLIKYWEMIGAIILFAAFVAPFIFKKDFDDESRNNVKGILGEMGSEFIKWSKWIAIIVVVVVLVNFISDKYNPTAVVRNSYFEKFSTDITIGEAFDKGFDRGEWKEFKENGIQYVRFTGYYVSYKTSNGSEFGNTCQIDFIVDGDTFDIAQVYADGVPAGSLSALILSGILTSVYERCGLSY